MASTSQWNQHLILMSLCSRSREQINKKVITEIKPDWFTINSYAQAYKVIKNEYLDSGNLPSFVALCKSLKIDEKIVRVIRGKEQQRKELRKKDPSFALPSSIEDYYALFNRAQHDAKHAKLINLNNELSEHLKEEMSENSLQPLLDLVSDTLDSVQNLRANKGELFRVNTETVKSKLKDFYKELKQEMFFVPTGFKDFDSINLGIPLDSTFVIAAKTGCGKTAMALSLAVNAKKVGARICFIPLEMSIEQMLLRLGSHLINVPVNEIVKDLKRYYGKVVKAVKAFIGENEGCLHFYIPDMEDTIHDILPRLTGYHMIIVDYLKLLNGRYPEEHRSLDDATRYSKLWSTRNKCITMLLAQLDDNTDDIRYSKAMKEHSSNFFRWKQTYQQIRDNGFIEVDQLKARNQSPHSFKLSANLACSKFSDYSSDYEEEEETKPRKRRKHTVDGMDSDTSNDVP